MMMQIFSECQSLVLLPYISNWHIINPYLAFRNCFSLSALPDISNWNLEQNYNDNNIKKEIFENAFLIQYFKIMHYSGCKIPRKWCKRNESKKPVFRNFKYICS